MKERVVKVAGDLGNEKVIERELARAKDKLIKGRSVKVPAIANAMDSCMRDSCTKMYARKLDLRKEFFEGQKVYACTRTCGHREGGSYMRKAVVICVNKNNVTVRFTSTSGAGYTESFSVFDVARKDVMVAA